MAASPGPKPTLADLRARLRLHASATDAAFLQGFFKTGPGQYGEGDVFIGVRLPGLRRVCRDHPGTALGTIERLLHSRVHEERALALLLLVQAFTAAGEGGRRAIYDLYLANTRDINNWDLVDISARPIVGGWPAGAVRR